MIGLMYNGVKIVEIANFLNVDYRIHCLIGPILAIYTDSGKFPIQILELNLTTCMCLQDLFQKLRPSPDFWLVSIFPRALWSVSAVHLSRKRHGLPWRMEASLATRMAASPWARAVSGPPRPEPAELSSSKACRAGSGGNKLTPARAPAPSLRNHRPMLNQRLLRCTPYDEAPISSTQYCSAHPGHRVSSHIRPRTWGLQRRRHRSPRWLDRWGKSLAPCIRGCPRSPWSSGGSAQSVGSFEQARNRLTEHWSPSQAWCCWP